MFWSGETTDHTEPASRSVVRRLLHINELNTNASHHTFQEPTCMQVPHDMRRHPFRTDPQPMKGLLSLVTQLDSLLLTLL